MLQQVFFHTVQLQRWNYQNQFNIQPHLALAFINQFWIFSYLANLVVLNIIASYIKCNQFLIKQLQILSIGLKFGIQNSIHHFFQILIEIALVSIYINYKIYQC